MGGSTKGIATIADTGPFHQARLFAKLHASGVPITNKISVTVVAKRTVNQMAVKFSGVNAINKLKHCTYYLNLKLVKNGAG